MFFVIFFVHNTHTIDFKIYNIHNFSLKQSRVFVFLFFFFPFFWLYNRTTSWWTQLAGSPTVTGKREVLFFLFFFYKTNRTKNTHTQRNTPRGPTQRKDSKDLLQTSLTPALPRRGGDVTNTDRKKQLCCYCCSAENCITIICSCCTIAVKSYFLHCLLTPPDSQWLPRF